VEIRNNADSMIYTSEKTLDELGDKVQADQKTKIEGLVKELREVIGGDDLEAIKAKTEELTKVVQEVGAAIYQQAQQEQASSNSSRDRMRKINKVRILRMMTPSTPTMK
jgi:molecular chaperone DnaK